MFEISEASSYSDPGVQLLKHKGRIYPISLRVAIELLELFLV